MSFDKATRNALARMVGQARERLKTDVMDQLRRLGFQTDGIVLDLDAIAGLSETEREAASALRDQLEHFISLESGSKAAQRQAAYDRMTREIGFTTLNRLVALRMAEERGLIVESVGKGLASVGFQMYERVAHDALGTRAETYRAYLELLYDELALDLPLLFDRMTPESYIFPSEQCLEETLTLLNDPALAHLWKEDEAIGWVYQYYNDPAERKKMRDASQAPRNSRELAVRNQFFTPRYVVEFLTDNTLGRIWYEMRRGETRLADSCQYLVRRKHPIWLPPGQLDLPPFDASKPHGVMEGASEQDMWIRPNPEIHEWMPGMVEYALTVDGYAYAEEHLAAEGDDKPDGFRLVAELANTRLQEYRETGTWRGTFEELRLCLFFEQRRWRHSDESMPEGDYWASLQALYKAICEAWDREADVIAYRPKKDPRDLRTLDPACGSGHFLLYSFDLLETIYEEAWADALTPHSEVTGTRLRDDYPDLDTLRRAVPGLILRHNLYGVDIDPRACQITGLALWLRAQRAYQQLGLKPAERQPITKSNIVCAEPMPGEREMLEEYLRQHVDPRLHNLVRTIWNKMQLAGEAGTLLKIEQEIETALARARESALATPRPIQGRLLGSETPAQLTMTLPEGDERSFWNEAEDKLLSALREYTNQATNNRAIQRRLFVEDAAQGFAFIDLCRQQFDVVLMNPPFGKAPLGAESDIQLAYSDTWKDLYAAFMERSLGVLTNVGVLGMISSSLFLYTKQLKNLRLLLIEKQMLHFLVELGGSVLDSATVETALTVISRQYVPVAGFLDATSTSSKDVLLRGALADYGSGFEWQHLLRFMRLYNWPLCYHLSDDKLILWNESDVLEPSLGTVVTGNKTFDDERFLRLRFEVGSCSIGTYWTTYDKGGEFQPFYSPPHLLVNWHNDGAEVRQNQIRRYGTDAQTLQSKTWWFKPGLAFPNISSVGFGPRVLPTGSMFSHMCISVFPNVLQDALPLLGFLASSWTEDLLTAFGRYRRYENAAIANLPITPHLLTMVRGNLAHLAEQAISLVRTHEESQETSAIFVMPYALVDIASIVDFGRATQHQIRQRAKEMVNQIDKIVGEALFHGDSRPHTLVSPTRSQLVDNFIQDPMKDPTDGTFSLLQYLIGCTIGRWDIRIGRDSSLSPKLDDPFAPLPICPPGMLVDPDGLPATPGHIASEEWLRARPVAITLPPPGTAQRSTIADSEYPIRIAWDGILVDDPEHPADIVQRVREVLAVLWLGENGTSAEAIEREVCEILGVRELRDYFRKPAGFFEDHLKRYSKSRRQAPIYWPLSTASGSYTLWIYYHRLTSDTLYTAVNRYVGPKIEEVGRRLADDERELESASGREASRLRASVEQEQTFLRELQEFRDELLRVAALPYRPDLNDGVIITAAPLHRLFRLPRWARDTKATWEKLERGNYDWAHLAHALWPERVREKCRTDKSLAIAHRLEELYVEPPVTAKKARGRKATRVAEEVELLGEEEE